MPFSVLIRRPKSGSMLLYSRKKVRYRRDGYCWKKRKDGKTTREDHMKLKVQGTEVCIMCWLIPLSLSRVIIQNNLLNSHFHAPRHMYTQCIYGCYVRFLSQFSLQKKMRIFSSPQVHSAVLPTFHRRCYWLLQNPDIVLVHYLNVPYPDDRTQHNKLIIAPSLLFNDKKEWTKEELLNQLKPMCRNFIK